MFIAALCLNSSLSFSTKEPLALAAIVATQLGSLIFAVVVYATKSPASQSPRSLAYIVVGIVGSLLWTVGIFGFIVYALGQISQI